MGEFKPYIEFEYHKRAHDRIGEGSAHHELVIAHNGDIPEDPVTSLYKAGVPFRDIYKIFKPVNEYDGVTVAFLPKPMEMPTTGIDLEAADRTEVRELALDCAQQLLQFNNPSLDKAHKLGFNDHSIKHITRVVDNAILIGERLGLTNHQINRLVISAAFHDEGNFIDRSSHHEISAIFIDNLVPWLSDEDRGKVKETVRKHDEKPFSGFIAEWMKQNPGEPERDLYQALRDNYGTEALTLVLADKMDAIGSARTPKKNIPGSEMLKDGHALVSALSDVEVLYIDDNGNISIVYQLDPYLSPVRKGELDHLRNPLNPLKIDMPPEIIETHRQHGLPVSTFWLSEFAKEYWSRMAVIGLTTAALFPQSESTSIQLIDRPNRDNFSIQTSLVLQNGSILETIEQLQQMGDNQKEIEVEVDVVREGTEEPVKEKRTIHVGLFATELAHSIKQVIPSLEVGNPAIIKKAFSVIGMWTEVLITDEVGRAQLSTLYSPKLDKKGNKQRKVGR